MQSAFATLFIFEVFDGVRHVHVRPSIDADFFRDLSELRFVKDDYEIREMRLAVDATKQGFDDVIADLPEIIAHPRGERLVEGTFYRRARAEGNTVGYDTIAASGPHACTHGPLEVTKNATWACRACAR